MPDTPEEREQKLARDRRLSQPAPGLRPNPAFGSDIFDPNARLPMLPSDPKLAEPLPQGRFIDDRIPSQVALSRAQDARALRENPKKYVNDHAPELANEQSLMDKGKTMLSRLFDYQDKADAQLFGVDLSAVESVWDKSLRYITGAYDLLNIGFGGLISAAPGGVRTLSYEELSGGKSVGEVFGGEMERGSAPSPGQIAVASVGLEAKRIRDGKARLSDLLLLNPATAPFLIAALAAESSPIQQEGFDIMNKEQRERAFGSGFEQWMSGITDAGLMFADPAVGAGVVFKMARSGALVARGTLKEAAQFSVHSNEALDKITTRFGDLRTPDEFYAEAIMRQPDMPPGTTLKQVKETGDVQPPNWTVPTIWDDTPIPDAKEMDNILAPTYMRLAQKSKATGEKVMSAEEIAKMPEIAATTNPGYIGQLLHDADNVYEVALVFEAMKGTDQSMRRLGALAPALADQVLAIRRAEIVALRAATEPAKIKESADYLARAAENLDNEIAMLDDQIKFFEDRMARISPDADLRGVALEQAGTYTRLKEQHALLTKSREDAQGLYRLINDGEVPDLLDQRSPFFNADEANRILDDLHRRQSFISRINKSVFDASQGARFTTPSRNNFYSRAVVASRERRGRAAYQYSVEKTSLLPRRKIVSSSAAGPVYKLDWWSSSQFEGVNRLQRNVRVWRWFGTETPSGYIGLKGTSTVGSEREFNAALDLDVYRGEPVMVTVLEDVVTKDKNGKDVVIQQPKEIPVGGTQRRNELFSMFYKALNDPTQDAKKVLMDVEEEVLKDLMNLYGFHSKQAQKNFVDGVLKQANKNREIDLKRLHEAGEVYDNGTLHYVPWLETHLANGTMMHNWQALESLLRRDSINAQTKGIPSKVRQSLEVPAHLAGSAYELFNDLWRPATLLRLSYTQRNVFEGMVRAMAYSASLAPLTWPVRGTYNGIRNKIVKQVSARQIKQASRKIEASEFGGVWREYTAASNEYYRLRRAHEMEDPKTKKTYMTLIERRPGEASTVERLTPAEYEAKLQAAHDKRADALAVLRTAGTIDKFTEAVKGTAFAKWRDAQINDLSVTIQTLAKQEDIVRDHLKAIEENGVEVDLFADDTILNWFGTQAALLDEALRKQDMLLYNPLVAMQDYGAAAGRQRRIGSGTSMGPDGNFYGNAFDGPLEQINRGLMSADSTVKQTLSAASGVIGNPFYRVLVRENPVFQFSEAKLDQWSNGLAQTIEDASSSRVVRMLMDSAGPDSLDFNVDAVINWMISGDKEAEIFTRRLMSMFGSDPLHPVRLDDIAELADPSKMISAEQKRLTPFAATEADVSGREFTKYDPQAVANYVQGVADTLRQQLQDNPDFFAVLRRRISEKENKIGSGKVTGEEIARIVRQMPVEQRNQLGTVQGSEMIQMGTNAVMGIWTDLVNRAFKFLGTMPEDAVTRGPFYNMRYKETRNQLIEAYWMRTEGKTAKEIKALNKRARTQSGRPEGGSIEHPEFEIEARALSEIEEKAHRRALMDTREWMYTIERRTKLGKYGEWIYPFISATQNTATVTGKLLWKEPWLAPMIADIWRMPQRLGVEDENGNLVMPMPLPWVRDWLADHPDVPFLGGAVDSADTIKIPKNGLNVWMPETGFGLVPTPTAWVQVGASELMKAGAFPIETPPIFHAMAGKDVGDQLYNSIKDYFFGEGQGMSDKLLSWDMLFPASAQKIINMKDEMSAQYGYQFAMQNHTQRIRKIARERDDYPTEEEIHKRATNMFWFQFFGNIGLPTPVTPYPILTRPQVEQTPVKVLQDVYGKMRSATPMDASMNMERMFGDWGLGAALTKVTVSVGGAQPTPETVTDIQKLQPLIRKIAPDLGDNLGVLGMLVNNRTPRVGYDQSSYQWQKSAQIPGRGENWRMVQPAEMSEQERQRVVGWTVYRRAIDLLDAQLQNAGFTSYEVKGAEPYKAAKETLIFNMSRNPEYEGWWIDYQDIGGNRTGAAIRAMTMAVQDPDFQALMVQGGKTKTLSNMNEYLYYRNMVMSVVEATGKSIDHQDNYAIKLSWSNIRQKLRNSDERWAEIEDLYLSGDTSPKTIGAIVDPNAPLMVGAQ